MALVQLVLLVEAAEEVVGHEGVDGELDGDLPSGLGEPPPQRLQRRTQLQLILRTHQVVLDLGEVEWGELCDLGGLGELLLGFKFRLELPLDGFYFFLEGVVQLVALHGHPVLLVLHHHLLLLELLDDVFLLRDDPSAHMQLLDVAVQEGLPLSHLVPDRQQTHFVQSDLRTHRLQGKQELFGEVEDLLGKVCPLGLRVYQSLLGVFFLFLEEDIVLL